MRPEIEQHRAAISDLCRRYRVRRLDVFGSAARGGDFDPAKSDADFLVEFDRSAEMPALDEFFGFRDSLEQVLGRPVDLVESGAVKNPYILASINRSKECVYGA